MPKKILIAGLGLLLVSMPGRATIVALWDFENDTTSPFTPSSGTQAGTASLTASAFTVPNEIGQGNYLSFAAAGSFTIQVSGTGLADFVITYSARKTGGSGSQTWEWSINGTTFTPLASQPPNAGNSFGSLTADFSAVSTIEGASTVYFRNTFGSATDYDNINVNVVPEPVNIALACFGLGFVGLTVGRRAYALARSQRALSA